jgi:putative ABC transport system permease protein
VGATASRAILVKTIGPPMATLASVKREIWSIDRGVAIASPEPLTALLTRFSYSEPRLGLAIFGAFAGIGLVLVVLGVSGVVAYTVSRQTHEIGIRIALGAERRNVLQATLGMGLRWVALGMLAGVVGSLAATRALASQLFDVSPTDPLTLGAVVTIVSVAGLLASYFPALRATRVDPMVVLRSE